MKQGVRSIPQRKIKKETTLRPRYESGFNGYFIFVLTLVIKLWSVEFKEEEVVKGPLTQSYVGHVIKLDMLQPHVTH